MEQNAVARKCTVHLGAGTLVAMLAAACVLIGFPSRAFAQCESRADTTPVDYREYREGRYTICYSGTYPEDLEFVDEWVSRTFDLGFEKYGVATPMYGDDRFYLTVYLPGVSTKLTWQGKVQMPCCFRDGDTVHAEVHYLTPSAWKGHALGGLGQPPKYYHAHYITHEVIHFFQWACCQLAARDNGYSAPTWLTEGMAESDGYRHTTVYNRSTAIRKLHQRMREREADSIIYGRTLLSEPGVLSEQGITVTSIYWAGGWIMNYLANRYGDRIHVELLHQPMADVLATYGTTVEQLFSDLEHEYRYLGDLPTSSDYTPVVDCTGRYTPREGGHFVFQARILNAFERPDGMEIFQQQYRQDAQREWVADGTNTGISLGRDTSNFSNPLFTGPDSAPFQWRVRACYRGDTVFTDNGTCSLWSNIVNWTSQQCASRQ